MQVKKLSQKSSTSPIAKLHMAVISVLFLSFVVYSLNSPHEFCVISNQELIIK